MLYLNRDLIEIQKDPKSVCLNSFFLGDIYFSLVKKALEDKLQVQTLHLSSGIFLCYFVMILWNVQCRL